MIRRSLFVFFALAAMPAAAQTKLGTVRQSPFVAGESRIYDRSGNLVGTARESPFVPGEVRLYDREGKSTGIEVRPNAFDPNQTDIVGDTGADEH